MERLSFWERGFPVVLVFNHFQTLVQKDPPNGETEARTPSPTAPNLPGLCMALELIEWQSSH